MTEKFPYLRQFGIPSIFWGVSSLYAGNRYVLNSDSAALPELIFNFAFVGSSVLTSLWCGRAALRRSAREDVARKDVGKMLGLTSFTSALLAAGVSYDAFLGVSDLVPKEYTGIPAAASAALFYASYYFLRGKGLPKPRDEWGDVIE